MNKKLSLAICLVCLLVLTACGQSTGDAYHLMLRGMYKNTVPLVNADDLEKKLSAGSGAKPVLLDTRSRKEYDVSHLQGARFANYDTFHVGQVKDLPKTTPIVVYCSVGYRSERIGEQLIKAGYTNVYNLYGGIFEWVNKELPVYDDNGQTQQVHAYSRTWGVWLTKGEKVYE